MRSLGGALKTVSLESNRWTRDGPRQRTGTPIDLPALPYALDALTPHISQETLEFHYDKHHQGYVTNPNARIDVTDHALSTLGEIITSSEGAMSNNSAQIWNHTCYWNSMSPDGGGEPTGEAAEAINRAFGSYTEFGEKFTNAAKPELGSGWAWVVDDGSGLKIMKTSNADLPLVYSTNALLTTDVWEHDYYIEFRNARPACIDTFMDHLINWYRISPA